MQATKLRHFPMTSAEAAAYLEISLGHLYNLIANDRGPRHVKYGGQLRFRPADLDRWVAGRCRLVRPTRRRDDATA